MGKLQTREAQIVLGAAVIDDVMGLIILAVVSAIVTLGAVSVGAVSWIVAKALLFLIGSIVAGQLLAPRLGLFLSKIHTGVAMKFTLAIVFALVYSYIAGVIGLAPIVGAFAAGLVLDPVHFKYFRKPKVAEEMENHTALLGEPKHPILKTVEEISEKHVEDLVAPIGHFFVPIFFVITGMNVKLETMFNPKILGIALGITVIAFIGKYVSGMVAGSNVNKHLVGFGMVPRGEVGLIFATIGISLGVISNEVFSVIVIMVILTTLLTPPILSFLLKRSKSDIAPQEAEIAY
jgi:Kef-type K+ transport system membrane component KefB